VLNFVVSLASRNRPTILIADDNYGLRSLLRTILTREGYRVVEAVDGVRALRLLAEEGVDAVLMDVHFGAEDGIALGRELRRERPNLPIALMSGDSAASEARKRGASLTNVFLMKPFTLERATATVEQLLGRR
jgi:two-component system, OmpR family, response regulator